MLKALTRRMPKDLTGRIPKDRIRRMSQVLTRIAKALTGGIPKALTIRMPKALTRRIPKNLTGGMLKDFFHSVYYIYPIESNQRKQIWHLSEEYNCENHFHNAQTTFCVSFWNTGNFFFISGEFQYPSENNFWWLSNIYLKYPHVSSSLSILFVQFFDFGKC